MRAWCSCFALIVATFALTDLYCTEPGCVGVLNVRLFAIAGGIALLGVVW